jgi:hypothetical protein
VSAQGVFTGVTLACRRNDRRAVLQAVIENSSRVTTEPNDADWVRITAEFEDGELSITTKTPTEPEEGRQLSDFGRIILGINNLLRKSAALSSEDRGELMQRLRGSAMLVGVAPDPELSDSGERWECVLGAAQATDALIFDGVAIRDSEGNVLTALAPPSRS